MTAYATQADLVERYGEKDVLLVADRDSDGIIDAAVVTKALEDATAEIDTYVAAKYELPLAQVPEVLSRLCCDIALYRLSGDAGVATEEKRQRYEDAVDLLKLIAKGAASLGLETPPPSSNGVVVVSGNERRFSRKTQRGTW